MQPSISGTPQVGETLTGSDGTISNGTVSARAWLRAGSAISGATGSSYVLQEADEGQNISYRVTATGAGGSANATSAAVGPVTAAPAPSPTLNAITLSNSSVAENTAAGAVVGAIQGKTSGSTLSLTDDAGGRFAISGTDLVTGSTATNYEAATSHSITIRETLAGATNTPRDTVRTITVTNVNEASNLAALTLDDTSIVEGETVTINIVGATAGSTITGTMPSGLTLNSGARTITGSVASSGTYNFDLVETLADSANSPRTSAQSLTVTVAPLSVEDTFSTGGSTAPIESRAMDTGHLWNLLSGSSIRLAASLGTAYSGGSAFYRVQTAGAVDVETADDIDVEVDIYTADSNRCSMTARFYGTDENNYIGLGYSQNNGWRLFQCVAGVNTNMTPIISATPAVGSTVTLRVEVRDGLIDMFVDGVEVASDLTVPVELTGRKVGLGVSSIASATTRTHFSRVSFADAVVESEPALTYPEPDQSARLDEMTDQISGAPVFYRQSYFDVMTADDSHGDMMGM
ncbi:putative Ig domain-containing protein [Croceicoccus sp. Ery15]|uniref:putative Ig domain-containing protein n=1 Tax=Croceicoccus sp. Ery15 TaxID=1703338 RepID=UPI001E40CE99|nr:putative Ig domain-containing protein [Croceicoccus sp. Ery15]